MTTLKNRLSILALSIALVIPMALIMTACDNNAQSVATINSVSISKKEFDENFKRFFTMHTGMANPDDIKGNGTSSLVLSFKKEALDFLIQEKLLGEEIEKRKLSVPKEEIEAVYKKAYTVSGISETSFQETLKKHDLTKNTYQALIEKQLAAEKLALAITPSANTVSDAEITQYFNAHRKEYDKPEMVEARHILIQPKSESIADKDAAKKKANDILSKVQANPKTFELLAKEHSQDTASAKNGGSLGFFSKEMMVPPFSKAAFSTPVGKITPTIVESEFGYHIIQVTNKTPAKPASLAEMKEQIKESLRQQQISKVLDAWLTKRKAESKITYSKGYDFDAEMAKEQAELQKEMLKAAPAEKVPVKPAK